MRSFFAKFWGDFLLIPEITKSYCQYERSISKITKDE